MSEITSMRHPYQHETLLVKEVARAKREGMRYHRAALMQHARTWHEPRLTIEEAYQRVCQEEWHMGWYIDGTRIPGHPHPTRSFTGMPTMQRHLLSPQLANTRTFIARLQLLSPILCNNDKFVVRIAEARHRQHPTLKQCQPLLTHHRGTSTTCTFQPTGNKMIRITRHDVIAAGKLSRLGTMLNLETPVVSLHKIQAHQEVMQQVMKKPTLPPHRALWIQQ